MLVTITGAFDIPQNADTLKVQFVDTASTTSVGSKQWCFTPAAGCDQLPAQTALSGTVTVVQSGAAHPHLKINGLLYKSGAVVGAGVVTADFASGQTVQVALTLTPQ